MNIIEAMNALTEIGKRAVTSEIDPENMHISTFTGHGGKTVVRGRTVKNGVMMTFDVYIG